MNKGSCMSFFPEPFGGKKEGERTLITLVHFFEQNLKILPGTSLVVQWLETLCSQRRRPGFYPWSGNYIPHGVSKQFERCS